jgi:undecaprenyl-diphosphatase
VDWSLFHSLNHLTQHSDSAQDSAEIFNAWAIFVLVAIGGGMWFVARPGGSPRPKLAAASAAISAALALVFNMILGQLWHHDRPFVDHPKQTVLLVHHAANNSFPSDHASVAFAIAFAVFAFHRRLGLLLLLGAIAVGLARIVVGVHYPVDVAASVLVGAGSAALVTTLGRPFVVWLVRQLSRLSDPIVATARRAVRL